MTLLRIAVILLLATVLFSGCATSPDTQQNTPKNTVQSSGTTVSGYVDVGAGKKIQ
jgi:uncharacterized lipoprotein YajG